MTNLDDIVDKFCQDHFGELSLYRYLLHSTSPANTEAGVKMIMKEYARECAKASLEKAAENAKTNLDCKVWNCEGESIYKESITNPENIVLL